MSPATRWKLMPWALLVPMVAFAGWRLHLALSDPHFAVEEDYYERARQWDDERAVREQSALLGWEVAWDAGAAGADALHLRVSDRQGRPVEDLQGRVEAFHNARPSERRRAVVAPVPGDPGRYRATLAHARPGVWQWSLRLERGEDVYVEERRLRVADAGAAGAVDEEGAP